MFPRMHHYMVNRMKIIGINASPKAEKSQTRRLVAGVLEGARQAGADVTFIDICSLDIHYCTACGTCYAKGECIYDDDYPALFEKLLDADGIVLGSPNYINQVTAQLKTMQEVITLGVFAVFSTFYLGEAIRWNHIVAFTLLAGAAFFAFHEWK